MQGSPAVPVLGEISVWYQHSQCQERLSVLGACVKSGDEITFICEGPDEEKALADMVALVESGLGE